MVLVAAHKWTEERVTKSLTLVYEPEKFVSSSEPSALKEIVAKKLWCKRCQ